MKKQLAALLLFFLFFYQNTNAQCPINNNIITIQSPGEFCGNGDPNSIVGSTPTGGSGSYTYQWQKSTDGINYTNIAGATGINYDPPAITQTTYYRRVVNDGNCSPNISGTAVYTLLPVITYTIATPSSICNGAGGDPPPITGSVPVGGTGSYTYQWQIYSGGSWVDISGATSKDYDPPFISATTSYRRILTSGECTSTYNVTVYVYPGIGNNTITPPVPSSFCGSAYPGGIWGTGGYTGGQGCCYTYQWESSSDSLTWTAISGATNYYYYPPLVTATTYFRLKVTSGGCSSYSNGVKITIYNFPPVTFTLTPPSPITFCGASGDPGLITATGVTGGNGTYTYQWQVYVAGTYTNIAGATTNSYDPPALTQTTYYNLIVSSGPCNTTKNYQVNIYPAIGNNIITAPSPSSFCGSAYPGGIWGTGGYTGGQGCCYTYQWESSPDSLTWTAISGATNYYYYPPLVTVTTYYRLKVTSGGCSSYSNVVKITIYNFPPITFTLSPPSPLTFCGASGDPSLITATGVTGGNGTYTYQWQVYVAGTYTNIAGATTNSYDPPALTQTTYYNLIVSSGPCNTTKNYQVNIYPAIGNNIITAPSPSSFCGSAYPGGIWGTGGYTGGQGCCYTYQWESSPDSLTWTAISGATNYYYYPPLVTVTTYYRLKVTSGGCSSYSNVVKITIYNFPPVTFSLSPASPITFCNGSGDPSLITAAGVTGGNGAYTYQWQVYVAGTYTNIAGANSNSYDPPLLTQTGYYNLIVSSGPCSTTKNYQVNIYPPIGNNIITPPTPNSFCGTGTPGGIWGTGGYTGGQGCCYTYQWENSTDSTTWTTISGASNYYYYPPNLTQTMFYRLRVTSGGCSGNSNVVRITIKVGNNTLSTLNQSFFCGGGDPDTIHASVPTYGVPAYTYQWQISTNGVSYSNIAGANSKEYNPPYITQTTYYRRLSTDNAACSSTSAGMKVTIDPVIINNTITPPNPNVFCGPADPAAITGAAASGGNGTYTYQWQMSSNNVSFSNISGATGLSYDPSLTGSTTYFRRIVTSGFCADSSVSVAITITAGLPISVSGNTNICGGGSASLTASGGLSYVWSPASGLNKTSGAIVIASPSVTITYTVTGTSGSCSGSASITIVAGSLNIIVSTVAVTCNGACNGSAVASVTGGNAPYSFIWSNGKTGSANLALCPATYTVVVTDNGGCSGSKTANITQPAAPLSLGISTVSITCSGAGNGNAVANVSGGTTPYSYNWSNGSTAFVANNLSAGKYYLTVTDLKGCTITDSVNVGQPSVITSSLSSTTSNCGQSDGTATILVSGGNAPYRFLWNNGQTTITAIGLSSANYQVTVTDINGCTRSDNVQVFNNPGVTAQALATVSVSCFGSSTGAAFAGGVGGSIPYSYLWSNGTTRFAISNLQSGIYSVTVTDNTGCTSSTSFNISQAPLLSALITSNNVSCNGGNDASANVNVGGGTPGYSYLWNNGETNASINNLIAGNYQITVTDANGCTTTGFANVSQPALLSMSVSSVDVSCFGKNDGSANANVTGGAAPYLYSWSNGATTSSIYNLTFNIYNLIVTDANGCTNQQSISINQPSAISFTVTATDELCAQANGVASIQVSGGTPSYNYNWSNGNITSQVSNLTSQIYSVTVTDSKGCSISATAVINNTGLVTAQVVITASITCSGVCNGAAMANVSGGLNPYSFYWSNGVTTQSANNLCASTYSLVAVDANGCTASASASISQPAALSLTTNSSDITCNGSNNGTATVSASGGTAPYNYNWSNGASTNAIYNLTFSIYNFTVTDANGCTASGSVNINEPVVLNASVTSNPGCGIGNSTALANANGGTAPYNYLWGNGASGSNVNGLSPGVYIVIITDINSCVVTKTVSVLPGNVVNVTISGDTTIVLGTSTTLSASVNGFAPYSFNWYPSIDLNCGTCAVVVASPKENMQYCVEVTDSIGCADTSCVTILVDSLCKPFIPNAFSPDNDKVNDLECLYSASCFTEIEFKIFSRWGELVFETKDITKCWDGINPKDSQMFQQAVFYYTFDGKYVTEEHYIQKGTVTIVR